MLSSHIFYRGVQRTDRKLHHMVQRQSPEVQYQQNHEACVGLLLCCFAVTENGTNK